MSLYYTLGNLVTLVLNVTHMAFYFRFRSGSPWRTAAGFALLFVPWIYPIFHTGSTTDCRWALLVIAYAFYCAGVFRLFLFQGTYTQLLFGIFSVGSFAGMNQIATHAFSLHILGLQQADYTFWFARASQIASCLVFYPIIYIYVRRPVQIILDAVKSYKWHQVLVAPMLFFMLSYTVVGITYHYQSGLTLFLGAIAVGAIVVFYWTLYFTIVQGRRNRFLNLQLEASKKMLPYYERYNAELERKEAQIRTLRHDVRHLIGGFAQAALNGDADKVADLVAGATRLDGHAEISVYSENRAVNAIVSFYFSMAKAAGVSCEAQLAVPGRLRLPDAELAMLLGNALDNCVKATVPLREKGYIKFSGKRVKDCVIFKFTNNFRQGEVPNGEGLGLDSMRALCEQYAGTLEAGANGDEYKTVAILSLRPEGANN